MTASEWSEDFDDLIAELIEAGCEFVIVGAHALAVYGHARSRACRLSMKPSSVGYELSASRTGGDKGPSPPLGCETWLSSARETQRSRLLQCGAPGTIRTCDLWLRRPTLYPAELRAQTRRAGSPAPAGSQLLAQRSRGRQPKNCGNPAQIYASGFATAELPSRPAAAIFPREMSTLQDELKRLIVSTLELEDVSAEDIDVDTPLFGQEGSGLGLDSIDALELAMAISKHYGITLKGDDEASRAALRSVATLAAHIQGEQAAR